MIPLHAEDTETHTEVSVTNASNSSQDPNRLLKLWRKKLLGDVQAAIRGDGDPDTYVLSVREQKSDELIRLVRYRRHPDHPQIGLLEIMVLNPDFTSRHVEYVLDALEPALAWGVEDLKFTDIFSVFSKKLRGLQVGFENLGFVMIRQEDLDFVPGAEPVTVMRYRLK